MRVNTSKIANHSGGLPLRDIYGIWINKHYMACILAIYNLNILYEFTI